jgi:hypothetical protein
VNVQDRARAIRDVCGFVSAGSLDAAAASLRASSGGVDVIPAGTQARVPYSRSPLPATKRRQTLRTLTALFLRDGFVDRYSGDRLVFPGVLRLLSDLFPADFPYHPNWKFGIGHPWYWDLYPTVDHVVPVTLQGEDAMANWVTTSMRRNLLKSNRSLEDLGWRLVPPGRSGWDGLTGWYVRYLRENPSLAAASYLKGWYHAAIATGVA